MTHLDRRTSPAGMSVLSTKLHLPTARRRLVARERLVQRMGAEGARLVLVSAPAGFGKTAVVTQG